MNKVPTSLEKRRGTKELEKTLPRKWKEQRAHSESVLSQNRRASRLPKKTSSSDRGKRGKRQAVGGGKKNPRGDRGKNFPKEPAGYARGTVMRREALS